MPNSAQRTPADRAPAREPSRARSRADSTLVLLTRERVLLQAVRAASGGEALATVASESDLATQIAAGHGAVAIIDAACASTPIADLTRRLATQFPDLVMIVAGDSRDQGALSAHITDGIVHRFLHKPVSRERVQLFVESAWRRRREEPPQPPPVLVPPLPQTDAPRNRGRWIGIASAIAAVGLAGGAALWLTMGREDGAGEARFRPAGSMPAASDERAAELEQLLGEAEAALASGRIEEAERLATSARELQPDHARISFLDAQIGKERERGLLTRAREAAAGGNVEAAIGLLEGVDAAQSSMLIDETRRELERRHVDDRVADFLRRAEARAAAGALIEPAQDNAHFLIQSAQALAPDSQAVRAAQRSLAKVLLESSSVSLASGDAAAAERWLDAAQESGADAASLARLRGELQKTRTAARAASFARLVANFDERIAENRLREPAGNSAKHWLSRLVASDPAHPATKTARETYASRALAEGASAVARGDLEAADAWLAEGRSAGAQAAESTALEKRIVAARQASSVVDASALQRTRYVEPRYPPAARKKGSGGWVDLEFTVATDGSVGDVTVTRSEPQDTFDSAAATAVRKWRYRPVMRDEVPVEQRARVRIVFVLE